VVKNFVLNEDIVWTEQIMDMYNAAYISIRNITMGDPLLQWSFPADGNIYSILNRPNVFQYGKPMENITTGGTISQTNTISSVNASTRTHRSNFYLSNETTAAYGFSQSITVFGGVFAGVGGLGAIGGVLGGKIKNLFSFDVKAGVTLSFDFSMSNEQSTSFIEQVESGYSLLDNDVEDQLSVLVIQPIAQNHTPYFEYFGGRSSCPPEEGSIYIDNPSLQVFDLETGGASNIGDLENVPDGQAGIFNLLLANQSPFETRELSVRIDPSTNENGGIFTLNGTPLNTTNYVASLPSLGTDTLTLSVERGPLFL
jgi:hypothetical protein